MFLQFKEEYTDLDTVKTILITYSGFMLKVRKTLKNSKKNTKLC